MAWLDELDSDEENVPSEDTPESTSDQPIVAEEFVNLSSELTQTPDWLKDLAEEAEQSTQPTGELQAEALEQAPDWLDELQEISSQEADESEEEFAAIEENPELEKVDVDEAETPSTEAMREQDPALPEEESDWIPEATIEDTGTVDLPEGNEPILAGELEAPVSISDQTVGAVKAESNGLELARKALNFDNLDDALGHYKKLLRNRDALDEVIADLQAALSKYPKHVDLWQMLGDAYMGKDRLRDALESYTKAEELL